MFNSSQSFYFSYDVDLTQSLQRKHDCGDQEQLYQWQKVGMRCWSGVISNFTFVCFMKVDERFFWNKHMISEFINGDLFVSKLSLS